MALLPPRLSIVNDDDGAYEATAQAIRELNGSSACGVVISGDGPTSAIADNVANEIEIALHSRIHRCTIARATSHAISKLGEDSRRVDARFVVAVGGGKTLDSAKQVCQELRLPLIVLPTALSSDGLASPIAVCDEDKNRRRSSLSIQPSAAIINTAITTGAPRELAVAGLCDLLSNASALLDLKDAQNRPFRRICKPSMDLAEAAYQHILPVPWASFHHQRGHARLARALVLSGTAMALAGSSAPCSGAEHAISHGLEQLGFGGCIHGILVGVCTVYCHHLRIHLGREGLPIGVIQALAGIQVALTPGSIGITRDTFLDAVQIGKSLRPDRYTVLHDVENRVVLERAFDAAFAFH